MYITFIIVGIPSVWKTSRSSGMGQGKGCVHAEA